MAEEVLLVPTTTLFCPVADALRPIETDPILFAVALLPIAIVFYSAATALLIATEWAPFALAWLPIAVLRYPDA